MNGQECTFPECSRPAKWHFTMIDGRVPVAVWHLCTEHGKRRLLDWHQPRARRDVVSQASDFGIVFDIAFLFWELEDDSADATCYVQLSETNGDHTIRIRTGPFEFSHLDRELRQTASPRPPTHHAMASIITALGGSLRGVSIHRYDPDTGAYFANLLIRTSGEAVAVDVRPSDALVLAVICDVPILVSKTLLACQGMGDFAKDWGLGSGRFGSG
ncbi:MAG: bifunctional nuclease family protein [Planctomycetaceae bacterium]|nr:bifunctional nuclease family protein [Planctomycetaceae bacterium]